MSISQDILLCLFSLCTKNICMYFHEYVWESNNFKLFAFHTNGVKIKLIINCLWKDESEQVTGDNIHLIWVYHDKQIWQKIWETNKMRKNTFTLNLPPVGFDLPTATITAWSLTPNHLSHAELYWMGDLWNKLQSHSTDYTPH